MNMNRDYEKLFKKYNINYALIKKNDILYYLLKSNNDYKVIYKNKYFIIFKVV